MPQKIPFNRETGTACLPTKRGLGAPGFTLIELIVVLGIFTLIGGLGIMIGINTYQSYILGAEVKNFISIVRRTQSFSFANERMLPHGIVVQSNAFVLFKGTSFAARTPELDEAYTREPSVTVTGPTEVVFAPLSADPSLTAVWTFGGGSVPQNVSLNQYGLITW